MKSLAPNHFGLQSEPAPIPPKDVANHSLVGWGEWYTEQMQQLTVDDEVSGKDLVSQAHPASRTCMRTTDNTFHRRRAFSLPNGS